MNKDQEAASWPYGNPEHPFADLIGLNWEHTDPASGRSECWLDVKPALLNPHQVVHGGVLFSLADTGMGRALYPSLTKGELCATVDMRIAFHRPVMAGRIVCRSWVTYRGKRIAHLQSEIFSNDKLVASAGSSYSIFSPTRS